VKVKNYKGWYDEKEQADAFERAVDAWNGRAGLPIANSPAEGMPLPKPPKEDSNAAG
jgi:hypothetical protein